MMSVPESIQFLMEKANESIEAAQNITKPDFAVSRAYYGMFYAAEAALMTRGLQFKKHSSVIGSFNKEFVKQGIFPSETGRLLDKAFDYRMQGDYGMVPVDPDEAAAVLKYAGEFVGIVRTFLIQSGFLVEI